MKKKITILTALVLGLFTVPVYAQTKLPSNFVFSGGSYSLREEKPNKDTTTYLFEDIFAEKPDMLFVIPQQNYTPEQIKTSANRFYNECTQQDGPRRLCRIDYCEQNDIVIQTFFIDSLSSKASESKYGQGLRGLEKKVPLVRLIRITPKGSVAWGNFELEDENGLRSHPFGSYRSDLCNLNIF